MGHALGPKCAGPDDGSGVIMRGLMRAAQVLAAEMSSITRSRRYVKASISSANRSGSFVAGLGHGRSAAGSTVGVGTGAAPNTLAIITAAKLSTRAPTCASRSISAGS